MKRIFDNLELNSKKVWISTTGFRTLLLFLFLLESPKSLAQITELLKCYDVTKKSLSKDTIRITLNTLRIKGCEIARPSKANGNKYSIIKHPFVLNLTKEDVDSLLLIRERLANELDWKKVLVLNTLYEKLFNLTKNEEYIALANDTKPLNEIDTVILAEISNPNIIGKKVNLQYNSPKYKIENIDIIPQKLVYENSRLYLWCYSYKYERTSVLNVERIKKINEITLLDEKQESITFEVIYEIFGSSAKEFRPENNEEIIEETKTSIKVRAIVANEFWFIQRLFLFGSDFKILSPDFFKEKLISKIKLIQKGYQQ